MYQAQVNSSKHSPIINSPKPPPHLIDSDPCIHPPAAECQFEVNWTHQGNSLIDFTNCNKKKMHQVHQA